MKPFITIIIPAYNEQSNLKRGTLDGVISYMRNQKYSWEILLVNDGSTDQTAKILEEFSKKNSNVVFVNNHHMGKAATIMVGAKNATGEYILFSDMDQATPIQETEKMISEFKKGADIVIGSRADRKGAPLFRQILAYGNVILRTLILRLPYKDTQCGFKGFTSKSAGEIFKIMETIHPLKKITGPAVNAGFDMEILYLARKLQYKVREVPVSWRHQETKRVSFWRDAIASIQELLLIRYRAFSNAYKLKND